MLDRLVSRLLRAVIMSMIASLAAGTVICAHFAALRLFGGAFGAAAGLLGGGAALTIAVGLMIRYRNDLIDA